MLTKSQKSKVLRALTQHERFRNSYFWQPPAGASSRRRMEEQETWSIGFRHKGHVYEYCSEVQCSCKNVYYRGGFFVDGERKTCRLFKQLIGD